jgi:hypothetical protein
MSPLAVFEEIKQGAAFGATKIQAAPRGALSYPRCSREKFGGRFLGLMAYLDPKGEGDNSMMRHEALCHIPYSVGRNLEGCSWV